MLSKFFHYREVDKPPVKAEIPTVLLIPQETANGLVISPVCLETQDDPYAAMSFSDFTLQNMLAAGVPIKPLAITTDIRLGSDSAIESFNERLESISDTLFVQPEK